jgi:hypothetical protein
MAAIHPSSTSMELKIKLLPSFLSLEDFAFLISSSVVQSWLSTDLKKRFRQPVTCHDWCYQRMRGKTCYSSVHVNEVITSWTGDDVNSCEIEIWTFKGYISNLNLRDALSRCGIRGSIVYIHWIHIANMPTKLSNRCPPCLYSLRMNENQEPYL